MAAVVPRTPPPTGGGAAEAGVVAGLSSDPLPPCPDPDGAGWCRTGTRRLCCLVLLDRLCINKSRFFFLLLLFFVVVVFFEKRVREGFVFRHRPQPTEKTPKTNQTRETATVVSVFFFFFSFLATADPSWVCNGAGGATSGGEETRKTTRRTSE